MLPLDPAKEKPRQCTTDGAEADGGEDWVHDGALQPMTQRFTRRSARPALRIRPLVTIQVPVRDLGWASARH